MDKHSPKLYCVVSVAPNKQLSAFYVTHFRQKVSSSAGAASRPHSAKGQARQDTCYTHSHDILSYKDGQIFKSYFLQSLKQLSLEKTYSCVLVKEN